MKFLLLIIFFLQINIYPQNPAEIFKSELYQLDFRNELHIQQFNFAFETYSNIHPELIYYYIKYHQARFDSLPGDNYYFQNFFSITKHYNYLFKKWIADLRNELLSNNTNAKLTRFYTAFIDDYIDEGVVSTAVPDLESKTEINYSNYLIVKYYTQNSKLDYDPGVWYEIERKQFDKEQLSYYRNMVSDPSSYTKDDLHKLIGDWYLYVNNYSKDNRSDPAVILREVINYYYKNTSLFRQSEISFAYGFRSVSVHSDVDRYDTERYKAEDNSYNYFLHSLSVSYNYKIFLKEYFEAFNFIRFSGSAGFGLTDETYIREGEIYRNINVDGVSNRTEIFGFNVNELTAKSAGFFTADISIPVVYLGDNISFNLGAGISILNTNYELNYDYYYRKFDPSPFGPIIVESEYGGETNKKISSTDIIFFPELLIGINTFKPFLMLFTATTNMISLELGIPGSISSLW